MHFKNDSYKTMSVYLLRCNVLLSDTSYIADKRAIIKIKLNKQDKCLSSIRVSYVKLSGQLTATYLNKDFRVIFQTFPQSTKSGHQLVWGEHITATYLPIETDGWQLSIIEVLGPYFSAKCQSGANFSLDNLDPLDCSPLKLFYSCNLFISVVTRQN